MPAAWRPDPSDGLLSTTQEQALAQLATAWRHAEGSAGDTNRPAAEMALRQLYRCHRLDDPRIHWCGSPFELFHAQQRVVWVGSRQMWQALGQGLSETVRSMLMSELFSVHDRSWEEHRSEEFDLWLHAARKLLSLRDLDLEYVWESNLPLFSSSANRPTDLDHTSFEPLVTLAECAGPWIAHPTVVLICDRPSHHQLDGRNRLHCFDAPALAWPDGPALYRWHGIPIDEQLVRHPDLLTVDVIQSEPNSEIRRLMLERYGLEQFLQDVKGRVIDESPYGRLFEGRFNNHASRPSRFRYVDVENATLEPDGTRKRYMLLVPADVETARGAVAWTFGLEEHEYVLTAES